MRAGSAPSNQEHRLGRIHYTPGPGPRPRLGPGSAPAGLPPA
jgi:hypothetical protein